jgi:hypothetical protein
MKIEKKYQGTIPTNKILNEKTESNTDTYSCDYINSMPMDDLPLGSIIKYNGSEVPDGWQEVENINYNVITNGEAVKVGYQVDGKDVYRRRFNLGKGDTDKVSTGRTYMDATSINIIKWDGYMKNGNAMLSSFYASSTDFLTITVSVDNNNQVVAYYTHTAGAFSTHDMMLDLYYTLK